MRYAGLWLELKKPGTTKSGIQDNQREWLERMESVGYCAKVVYGFNDAITTIESYLSEGEGVKTSPFLPKPPYPLTLQK